LPRGQDSGGCACRPRSDESGEAQSIDAQADEARGFPAFADKK
jgi:hypothetical protein